MPNKKLVTVVFTFIDILGNKRDDILPSLAVDTETQRKILNTLFTFDDIVIKNINIEDNKTEIVLKSKTNCVNDFYKRLKVEHYIVSHEKHYLSRLLDSSIEVDSYVKSQIQYITKSNTYYVYHCYSDNHLFILISIKPLILDLRGGGLHRHSVHLSNEKDYQLVYNDYKVADDNALNHLHDRISEMIHREDTIEATLSEKIEKEDLQSIKENTWYTIDPDNSHDQRLINYTLSKRKHNALFMKDYDGQSYVIFFDKKIQLDVYLQWVTTYFKYIQITNIKLITTGSWIVDTVALYKAIYVKPEGTKAEHNTLTKRLQQSFLQYLDGVDTDAL